MNPCKKSRNFMMLGVKRKRIIVTIHCEVAWPAILVFDPPEKYHAALSKALKI